LLSALVARANMPDAFSRSCGPGIRSGAGCGAGGELATATMSASASMNRQFFLPVQMPAIMPDCPVEGSRYGARQFAMNSAA